MKFSMMLLSLLASGASVAHGQTLPTCNDFECKADGDSCYNSAKDLLCPNYYTDKTNSNCKCSATDKAMTTTGTKLPGETCTTDSECKQTNGRYSMMQCRQKHKSDGTLTTDAPNKVCLIHSSVMNEFSIMFGKYRDLGDSCTDNTQCYSDICTSNVCTGGAAAGVACTSTYDCQIGNSCVNSVCKAFLGDGVACSDSLGDCPHTHKCAVKGTDTDKCVAKGSIADGTYVTNAELCVSGYKDANSKCAAPTWTKYGETCTQDSDCAFNSGSCACERKATGNTRKCVATLGGASGWLVWKGIATIPNDANTEIAGKCRGFTFYDEYTGELFGCAYNKASASLKTFLAKFIQYISDAEINPETAPLGAKITCGSNGGWFSGAAEAKANANAKLHFSGASTGATPAASALALLAAAAVAVMAL